VRANSEVLTRSLGRPDVPVDSPLPAGSMLMLDGVARKT
jgi:hypothetical protein